ncbi:type II toxin-antitoxin system ParD family antitoxin [Microbacterium sp. SLBN-111]|uniref:type II toxin-antitoxin system ParD family antitoxin n=1 Tax=Microbacterium sp. SLBN-111 TaxID=3377733 RepID=UPI003C741C03
MATMNISLPDDLRAFADAQVHAHLYASSSEYVRELIRRDRETSVVREAVLEGMRSGEGSRMDADYFDVLRASVRDAS